MNPRPLLLLISMTLTGMLSGCDSVPASEKSPYIVNNDSGELEDIKVDGSAFYRRIGPGDSARFNLDRSTPHTVSIVRFNAFGQTDRETHKVRWNHESQSWDDDEQ